MRSYTHTQYSEGSSPISLTFLFPTSAATYLLIRLSSQRNPFTPSSSPAACCNSHYLAAAVLESSSLALPKSCDLATLKSKLPCRHRILHTQHPVSPFGPDGIHSPCAWASVLPLMVNSFLPPHLFTPSFVASQSWDNPLLGSSAAVVELPRPLLSLAQSRSEREREAREPIAFRLNPLDSDLKI